MTRQMAIQFVFRNKWLVAAVVFEGLGLLAAFGTMPIIGRATAWLLAVTSILSCTGVLIVTVYFMFQYNRRPLNNFQKDEITRLLSEYTPSKEQREEIAGLLSEYTPAKNYRMVLSRRLPTTESLPFSGCGDTRKALWILRGQVVSWKGKTGMCWSES